MIPLISIFTLITAPFIGSFIANVAVRLPEGRSVLFGRSCCRQCGVSLHPFDLVPVFSWIILKGRCHYCNSHIGGFYPGVELATLVLAVWCCTITTGLLLITSFCFGFWLLLMAIIDAEHYWLPDVLTLPLIPAGLLTCWVLQPATLIAHVAGVALGFSFFFVLAKLYHFLRDRDGIGLGDAKLLAALGAWVSWPGLPDVVAIAAIGGLGFAILRVLVTKQSINSTERIAFGPFLAMAGWLVWLYADVPSLTFL